MGLKHKLNFGVGKLKSIPKVFFMINIFFLDPVLNKSNIDIICSRNL